MYKVVCVARAMGNDYKLKFFFGQTSPEAMQCALMARSAKFEADILGVSKPADINALATYEALAASLDASMAADERWVSASTARDAVNRLLSSQSIRMVH